MGNQSSELERNQMGESPCASEINTAILWKCVAAKHCYQGTLPLKHYFQIDVSQKSPNHVGSEVCEEAWDVHHVPSYLLQPHDGSQLDHSSNDMTLW
jgi:hypothetical protein